MSFALLERVPTREILGPTHAPEDALPREPQPLAECAGEAGEQARCIVEAAYYYVIANEWLVDSYEMHLDHKKVSVSLATLQSKAEACKLP